MTKTIAHTYDPLYRLTAADYTPTGAGSTGEYFHYEYDNAGNRLREEKRTTPAGAVQISTYAYDIANRLVTLSDSEGSHTYVWDANGNLLSDGVTTYTYNHANRLVAISSAAYNATFLHNGLGDRLSETVAGVSKFFVLDINTSLTQVLSDGTNFYLYGLGRIAQSSASGSAYFLGDALGSVRQLTDANGNVTLSRAYEPYGGVLSTAGASSTCAVY